MSKLTDLLRQVERKDPQLAADLDREYKALSSRRAFGLNFERHHPESTEIPGRVVRKGDKVRILPPRRSLESGSKALWVVQAIERVDGRRVARLMEYGVEAPNIRSADTDDLVVVSVFRDYIYPGLVPTGTVERGGDKPHHTVIRGENFHALQALSYTHKGKIDVIYIDPPYNTGAKDWKYNNDYVEGEDIYRHSKWLAFMERRLQVAKELLNPEDSILIVTIDEKEYLRLGLLLEQALPEARIQMTTIVINPNGVARGAELARVEEYAYFCFFGAATPSRLEDTMLDQGVKVVKEGVRWEWLMRGGSNSRRVDRPNLFYPIYVDRAQQVIREVGEPIPHTSDRLSVPDRPGLATLWPVRSNGIEANWRTSPEYLRTLLSSGMAKLGAYDAKNDRWSVLYLGKAQIRRIEAGEIKVVGQAATGALQLEQAADSTLMTPKTVWNRSRHSAGEHGSRMLRALLPDRSFPFPKSLYAVEDCLRVAVRDKPNAVVLDFFAGSGTTAHAVMRLNHQDGGNRQCISVTNNEVGADEQKGLRKQGLRPGDPEWEQWGICDHITMPRLDAVITGKTPQGEPVKGDYKFTDEFPMSEGMQENARFFALTYETRTEVAHNKAFRQIAPLLWLRAGATGTCIDTEPSTGWVVAEAYGVLTDLDVATAFVEAVADIPSVKIAYVVTDDERRFQSVTRRLPEGVEAVRLYESYLRNFQIRNGG